jgi:hypothetical protein
MKTYEIYWSTEVEADSEEDALKIAGREILLLNSKDLQISEITRDYNCNICGGDDC